MQPDAALIRNAQMKSTGATIHRLANVLQSYQMACYVEDRDIAGWAADALYVFTATGQLPTETEIARAAV